MGVLTDFWKRLDGRVHPDDAPYFLGARLQSDFNLEFPPPAYFGAVDSAPVVVLYNNGRYSAETRGEFIREGVYVEYIDEIHAARPCDPGVFSEYYAKNCLRSYVMQGSVCWVNAIAYRSANTRKLARHKSRAILPSHQVSLRWLRDELLPEAAAGRRLVIFHRWSLWHSRKGKEVGENVKYSSNPVGENVSVAMREQIDAFLIRIGHGPSVVHN
jgi:hypothetical protein